MRIKVTFAKYFYEDYSYLWNIRIWINDLSWDYKECSKVNAGILIRLDLETLAVPPHSLKVKLIRKYLSWDTLWYQKQSKLRRLETGSLERGDESVHAREDNTHTQHLKKGRQIPKSGTKRQKTTQKWKILLILKGKRRQKLRNSGWRCFWNFYRYATHAHTQTRAQAHAH